MGAAYGTAKSGVGIASMGVMRPELVMKSIVPVVMAGVLGIYGLIIAVIISTNGASLDLVPYVLGYMLVFSRGTGAANTSKRHSLMICREQQLQAVVPCKELASLGQVAPLVCRTVKHDMTGANLVDQLINQVVAAIMSACGASSSTVSALMFRS